jgi:hypothetical protein
MILSLRVDPPPKSLVFLVTPWHHAMARLSFIFDQLFILLVPELVVVVVLGNCPNEPDFVQNSLSIWSHFVVDVIVPLRANPLP